MKRHYSESELVSFHQQRMDAVAQEQVRVHVMECDSCLATYRMVREFFAPVEAMSPREMEGEWQALRNRWQQSEEAKAIAPRAPIQTTRKGWLMPRLAWAMISFLILAAGWFVLRNAKPDAVEIAQQTIATPTPLPTPAITVEQQPDVFTTATPASSVPVKPRPADEVIVTDLPRRTDRHADERSTRSSGGTQPEIQTLAEVKTLWIAVSGDQVVAAQIRQELQLGLASQSQFKLTTNPDEADAKLEIVAQPERQKRKLSTMTVRLVNSAGNLLWPLQSNLRGRKYTGEPKQITKKFLQHWLADTRGKARS